MLRLTLAISVLLLAVGCGGEVSSDPAIYDWEAQRGTTSEHGADDLKCRPEACPDPTAEWVYVFGAPKLAGDDFDRRTIRAAVAPETGEPVVYARFTPEGERRFADLTRTLAHRGAKLGTPQHLLLVVDRVVYAAPYIDYRRNPDGIPGDNGIQFSGLASLEETRKLAKALRGD